MHADADKQGLVQGMITGMRGLCNGLGPAMFGLIFSLFKVDLSAKLDEEDDINENIIVNVVNISSKPLPPLLDGLEFDVDYVSDIVPGPPFVFGALLVILALLVAAFIPDSIVSSFDRDERKPSRASVTSRHHAKRQYSLATSGRYKSSVTQCKMSDDSIDSASEAEGSYDGDITMPLIHSVSAKGSPL